MTTISRIRISGDTCAPRRLNGRGVQCPLDVVTTAPRPPSISSATLQTLYTRVCRKHKTRLNHVLSPMASGSALSARQEICGVLVNEYKLPHSRVADYLGGCESDVALMVQVYDVRQEREFLRQKQEALRQELGEEKLRIERELAALDAKLYQPFKSGPHVDVLSYVCGKHQITLEEIKGGNRSRRIAEARFEVCALLRELTPPMSYPRIGAILNRDHTTIMHGEKRHWELQKKLETA